MRGIQPLLAGALSNSCWDHVRIELSQKGDLFLPQSHRKKSGRKPAPQPVVAGRPWGKTSTTCRDRRPPRSPDWELRTNFLRPTANRIRTAKNPTKHGEVAGQVRPLGLGAASLEQQEGKVLHGVFGRTKCPA